MNQEYKFAIGDIVRGKKSQCMIVEQIKMGNGRSHAQKGYQCKCMTCGSLFQKSQRDLSDGRGCPVCANRKVVAGINDMWTTNPQLAKLLLNPDDGYKYVEKSQKKLQWTCPICQTTIIKAPQTVLVRGLSCPNCSTGVSIPNRFMRALLKELSVTFEAEKSFPWSQKKRYDFYLPDFNLLIEMQGDQHYTNYMFGRKEISSNDELKRSLALSNGVSKYVCIPARYSTIEYLSESVLNSELSSILNLSNVNWHSLTPCLYTPPIEEVVSLWKSGALLGDIAQELQITRTVVRKYLKRAAEMGLCDYDVRTSHYRGTRNMGQKKPVVCITTGKEFPSITAAEKFYGIRHISECCKGKFTHAGQYLGQSLEWKYADS